ncbi:MAG: SiaB family protein kinase [Bacteroidota bacterium]|nr:SiaB family protein kinase [Bacteroidota bacterium]
MEIFKEMTPNSIRLSYKGVVTFEIIDSVLNIISDRLDIIEENLVTRKKVYCILMESLQNLCNHIDYQENKFPYDSNCILLAVENDQGSYSINTGNFIPVKKVEELKNWIDKINNSSAEELKVLYNNVLTNNSYSTKGGGGLGFLDIARKSNNKLKYNFETIDESNCFFTLKITIKR